jgi:hypothetical protein
MTFVDKPQCDHGVEQARMPIYLGAWPIGSRSCGNECMGLEQPPGLIPSQ